MKNIAYMKQFIEDVLNSKKGSRFRQNFIKVAKANIFAQILPILAAPLLTRLYSPGDFGALTLLTTFTGFLLIFSTGRVEWSIPNTKSHQETVSLLIIGFVILVLSSGLFILTLARINHPLIAEKYANLLSYWPFVIISLLGEGLLQITTGVHIKTADMTSVSRSSIFQVTLSTGFKVAAGVFSLGVLGLVLGHVLKVWVGAIILVKSIRIKTSTFTELKLQTILYTYKNFMRECSFSVFVGAVNYGFLTLLPLSLMSIYSLKELGYYTIVSRIAIAPMMLISKPLSQSFWAEASKLVKENPVHLRSMYKKTLLRLAFVSIIPLLICLSGPLYIGIIFGQEKWFKAGAILAAITPQVIGSFIFGSTNHLIVYRKQHYQLLSDSLTIFLAFIWLRLASINEIGFTMTVTSISLIVLLGYFFRFLLHLKANTEYSREYGHI